MSSTAENLSPVPSPSIMGGEAGGSPVPTFEEAQKPKRKTTSRRKTAKRKTAKRKSSRRKVQAETTDAPVKRTTRRKTSKRKASRRKSAARRAEPAPATDVSIEAVVQAKRAELKELDKRAKLLEKQVAALEKML